MRRLRRLQSPRVQLAAAGAAMLGGGYLIAVWVMGLMLIVLALLVATDALLRDVKPDDEDLSRVQAIARRYQNSP